MQHTASTFEKKNIHLFILVFCITLLGCKKQTYRPEGIINSTGMIDPNQTGLSYWETTGVNHSDITHLESANGYLYYSRKMANGIDGLYRINPSGDITTLFTTTDQYSEISDLEEFGNRLYYSGRIRSINGTGGNVGYVEGISTTPILMIRPEYSSEMVISMHTFNNYLYFSGSFFPSSTDPNEFFTSPGTDKMNSSYETEGQAAPSYAYGPGILGGENHLYVHSPMYYSVLQSPLSLAATWNGANWESFTSGVNVNDEKKILGICETGDTLYVSSCTMLYWNSAWIYYDYKVNTIINGQISPFQGIDKGYDAQLYFKKVNGQLFAYGKYLSQNGKASNIYRLVNGQWVVDAIMLHEVIDIEYYNGAYYAATTSGLFKASF